MGCKYLYGWRMSQYLHVNDSNWVNEIYQFNEAFIKVYNEESDIGVFIEADVCIILLKLIIS